MIFKSVDAVAVALYTLTLKETLEIQEVGVEPDTKSSE
jgi:hypothetical protein